MKVTYSQKRVKIIMKYIINNFTLCVGIPCRQFQCAAMAGLTSWKSFEFLGPLFVSILLFVTLEFFEPLLKISFFRSCHRGWYFEARWSFTRGQWCMCGWNVSIGRCNPSQKFSNRFYSEFGHIKTCHR